MKKIFRFLMVWAVIVTLASCGGSATTPTPTLTGTPAITDISDMPTATSPMASSSSSDLSLKALSPKAATTGQILSALSNSSFTTSSSMAACEIANILKEAFQSAVEADTILCYVDQMNQATSFTTVTGKDIYDGTTRIFNLDFGDAVEAPDKVKMTIAKDSDGNINLFEMFACQNNSQMEYVRLAINDTALAMTAKGSYSGGGWEGSHSVDVSGTVNSSGAFTERTITVKNTGGATDESNTNWSEGALTQTPGRFVLQGYQSGRWSQGADSGTYAQSAYAVGELLNDTSEDLTALAMGDGAVKVDSEYTFPGGSYAPDIFIEAWNGDTALEVSPSTDSDFYENADAGTPPTVADSVTISYGSSETWDCSNGSVDSFDLPAINEAAIAAACEALNHNWINCYEIIQPSP